MRVAQEETNEADVYSQITRRNIRAKLLARRGDFDAAHEFARDAVVLGEPTEWLNLRGDTQMDLAEVLGLAGEADDAVSAVERALDLYVEKGNVVSARKARALLPHPPTKSSVRRR